MKKKILIIGGGAREYALGRKFREDTRIGDIYFSPGNGGTQSIGENVALENHEEVVRFATDKHIDLVVIGPQEPLIEGLSDALALAEIKVFGPSQKVSILEASKSFTKNLALNLNIPTPPFFICTRLRHR
ncbi:Phosphoribosylamine--glycine ligase [Helicobacter bizzozeronii CCUG 35545]|nr:Phosphoribosylamine--glycine ligase [Helicobacter bizzozeronii CCUG 35545]